MSVTIDPKTGWPVKPQKITKYWYVVWYQYCDGKGIIEASTEDELDRLYEEGRRKKIYGSIYEGGTRVGYDREEYDAYRKAWMNIWNNSCLMPPEEDLLLLSWAKKLPRDEWEKIDPEKGIFASTRKRLKEIRSELRWGK